jgi:hypothetical protein
MTLLLAQMASQWIFLIFLATTEIINKRNVG